MTDSPHFAQHSDTTVTKLQEADALLATQEAQLRSQLANVQQQRHSLQTVINLFNPAATTTPVAAEPPVQPTSMTIESPPATAGAVVAQPEVEPEPEVATTTNATEAAPQPAIETKTRRTASSPTSRNRSHKSSGTKTVSGQSLPWQQYVRQEFRKNSLPEAVQRVLEQDAEAALDIPTIVNAIFKEQRPQDVQNKVRHQITNILTEGVKKHKWYRPQPGYYSLSPDAT